MVYSTEKLLQSFEFFHQISEKLTTSSSAEQAADVMVRFLCEALELPSAAIWLYESQKGTFEVREHCRGTESHPSDVNFLLSNVAQNVLYTNQPKFISDDEFIGELSLHIALRSQNVSAVVAYPMVIGEQKIGVLFAFFPAGRKPALPEIQKLSGCVMVMTAMIAGLHSLRESQQRAWEMSNLIEVTQAMVSSLDLKELLEKISVHLTNVSGTDHCAISGYEPNPPRLITLAQYRASGEITSGLTGGVFYLKDYPLTTKSLKNDEVIVVRVDDPNADPAEVALLKLEQHQVLLMFPLVVAGKQVGLIELYSDKPSFQLSDDVVRQVQMLSKIVAIALNNARLYEREQRARMTAEMLRQSSEALNSSLELNRVIDLILEQLQRVVQYDSASLMLFEQEQLRIFAVRGHPYPEDALQVRMKIPEDELAKTVMTTRRCLVIEDAQNDPRFMKRGRADYVRGWMGIPMVVRDEMIGMLTLDSRTPSAYTSEDAELAQAFANQAGLAIYNARLYQSEKEQRTLAEVLHEISLILSSSLDPITVLQVLLEQVERVVPYDSACVMLVEGDTVRIAAHRGYDRFGVAHLLDGFSMALSQTPNIVKMVETRQPHYISNVKIDPEWVTTGVDVHIGSWLGAPLIAQEQLIGFLSLDRIEPGAYDESHACRLESLAGHAALALRNALAYGEAERASIIDFLTGAYNHRYFHKEIRHELEHARRIGYPVSLLMVDLDRFKRVNDQYGHQVGDRVLQMLVARLKSELRLIDVLVRYGGEEFTIILPGTPANCFLDSAERLRLAIVKQPFQIDQHQVHITVSIGGATYPDHAQEAHDLIACADRAMYQAKRDGRNCVRLFDAMRAGQ